MKCGGFFVAIYTPLSTARRLHYALVKLKRYLLHMPVYDYRTREIKSVVYGRNAENELVSRIKMADYGRLPCARKYRNAPKRSHYTKKAFFKH